MDLKVAIYRHVLEPKYIKIYQYMEEMSRVSRISITRSHRKNIVDLLADIVAIASFLFGFSIFGKITGSGIQALARNPLARSSIQINIIIEFILNIGIIIFGIIVSYFILTL